MVVCWFRDRHLWCDAYPGTRWHPPLPQVNSSPRSLTMATWKLPICVETAFALQASISIPFASSSLSTRTGVSLITDGTPAIGSIQASRLPHTYTEPSSRTRAVPTALLLRLAMPLHHDPERCQLSQNNDTARDPHCSSPGEAGTASKTEQEAGGTPLSPTTCIQRLQEISQHSSYLKTRTPQGFLGL